jgi:hypothetical protein
MSGLVGHVGLLFGAAAGGGGGSGSTTTWNPADKTSINLVLSNGDLTASETVGTSEAVRSTTGVSSGKHYWEIELDLLESNDAHGIRVTGDAIGTAVTSGTTCSLRADGTLFASGGASSAGGNAPASYVTGDVLMFALDMDNGKLWIGKNGAWPGSTNPATNTGHTFTSIPAGTHKAYAWSNNEASMDSITTINCGATAFNYTPPSGFSAL